MRLNKKQVRMLLVAGLILVFLLNSQTQSLQTMGGDGSDGLDLWAWLTSASLLPGIQNWMLIALAVAVFLLIG